MTSKPAPDSTHGLTRPAADDGTSPDQLPAPGRAATWLEGWAGALTLALLLAVVAASLLLLVSPGPGGAGSPPGWPALLAVVATGLLAAHAGWLMVRLRQQRAEVDDVRTRIRQLAVHDELTGLWTRRHAQIAFQIELQRATRSARPLCLALLDIDNLQQINDAEGHAVGDTVLRAVALEATQSLRKTDLLARWSGEEFLVLLPDTTMEDAMATLERLRQRVDDASIGQLAAHAVTVSIGVTQHGSNETLEASLDRANHALYIARIKGQNRVANT